MKQFKYTLGTIVGTVSAAALIFVLEMLNTKIYPLPAGYTMQDMEDANKVKAMMALMPVGAFVSVLLIYAIASFIGGIIAALVSGKDKNWPSIVTGIILFGIGLWDAIQYAQPAWFMAGCMACIPFAWYGYVCVRKRSVS